MSLSKLHAAALAAVSILMSLPISAHATSVSRETLNRRMLDSCVYRQYSVKDIDRMSMIAKCQCASDAATKPLEGDSFDVPSSGGLTGPQDQALRTATEVCFAPKAAKAKAKK